MSELEANTIEPSTVPDAIETVETENSSDPVETPNETPSSKPAGYAPIDTKTATPEQVEERINYLYKQIKPTERENREMRKLLSEQSRVIDELSKTSTAVVNHLTERSYVENEANLTKEMQEAWKKGDTAAYITAQNKILDLKVQQRLQPAQQQPERPAPNAVEIARGAVESGELSEPEYRITEAWQNEKDEQGNLLRPWAYSTDSAYKAALYETQSVMLNPRYTHWTYEQKLAEVDKRMGTAKRTASQNVMGGNLTKVPKNTKIDLSPKQREIALKTKYAGKGKSDAEHLDAYRKQIEKYNQRRAK